MTNFSNWMEAQVIQISCRGASWSAVNSCFISLLTTMQEAGDVYTETDAASYERMGVTFSDAATPGGTTSNVSAITWTEAETLWGTIRHIGIHTAATAGNIMYWADLQTERTVNQGDVFQIPLGNLDITIA